jgi:hypothetical protein
VLAPDGQVVWYCPLRFDADPVFWPLLDHRRGGRLAVRPAGNAALASFRYRAGTAVAVYEWRTARGRARVRAGMAWPPPGPAQELWWVIEGLSGTVSMTVDFTPAPGFGREPASLRREPSRSAAVTAGLRLELSCSEPFEQHGPATAGRLVMVRAGRVVALRLRVQPRRHGGAPGTGGTRPPTAGQGLEVMGRTEAAWRDWTSALRYDGEHRDAVLRSAITLKLLIYEPTGAVVAAATTALPERVGGGRNWDYRYCWLRDAGYTLNALHGLGCQDEARRYAAWMCRVTAASRLPLKVLYGVGGETELPETEIADAEGYRGSRPVRVGNAARGQFQLDSYGELLDCLAICEIMGDPVMRPEWPHFRRLAEFTARHWREPDSGIWEVRDRPRHFVHSKAMAWVALDRGARIAAALGDRQGASRWAAAAAAVQADVAARGVDPATGRYGRAYGEPAPDASLLMLPLVGFCAATTPAMAATIAAIRAELAPPGALWPGLLWRYRPGTGDGIEGGEGAFTVCSFWLAEALALAGRPGEARDLLAGLTGLAGDLGLFAEETDPWTGEQLGNLPQALTHIGLINAALCLHGEDGSARPARRGWAGRAARPSPASPACRSGSQADLAGGGGLRARGAQRLPRCHLVGGELRQRERGNADRVGEHQPGEHRPAEHQRGDQGPEPHRRDRCLADPVTERPGQQQCQDGGHRDPGADAEAGPPRHRRGEDHAGHDQECRGDHGGGVERKAS